VKLFVQVKPNARMTEVKAIDSTHFVVRVKGLPIEGRANAAVIEALAEYLDKPKSLFRIIRGFNARQKVVEMQE